MAVESCQTEVAGSNPCCCGPHVFTSVLLGVLACVLMTGGVFLAFHRWDPLWLIVSGIGVLLVIIGSILHCCRARSPAPVGKGCCLPDHLHNHVVLNGGSLTEQLLPLSNARSVSQLSLNMLPGYFPPVVATYGIEQHSTVVQNINRIIQQQTQSPAAPENPGKSFILLSLPGNTPQANIQNLVATVYQLDGSVLAETSTASDIPAATTTTTTTTTATVAPPTQSGLIVRKNAEVQTCSVWSVPNATNASLATPSTSNAAQTSVIMSTQTEDPPLVAINLMDCSPDPICDNSASVEAEPSTSVPLVQVSEEATNNGGQPTPLVDIAQNSISNLLNMPTIPSAIATNIPNNSSEVLIDISESSTEHLSSGNNPSCEIEQVSNSNTVEVVSNSNQIEVEHLPNSNNLREESSTSHHSTNNIVNSSSETSNNTVEQSATTLPNDLAIPSTSTATDSENNSLCVVDVDDIESLDRSSPPPSYEDVALQSETPPGVFGLAYGTL